MCFVICDYLDFILNHITAYVVYAFTLSPHALAPSLSGPFFLSLYLRVVISYGKSSVVSKQASVRNQQVLELDTAK